MRSLPRAVWQYATLLVFLFAIASLASWSTMSYLYDAIPNEEYSRALNIVSFKIWALTMGFMLISGAFGLWAIQFSAESESRFRVGQVVEGMDYLSDGLIVVDRKGRITGSNPSLKKKMPAVAQRNSLLSDVFPCLSEKDLELLLDIRGPNEIQKDILESGGRRTLRFRSQTAGGFSLVLISDVTTMRLRELQRQHVARFELIGRIARGVTNDFNNILTGISGHAALLQRLPPGSAEMKNSLSTVLKEAERGALLAGHLIEFSRLGSAGQPADNLGEHVQKASELIRLGLSSGWQVETKVEEDFPVVPLSGVQIEQAVLNLALVAADSLSRPGMIRITAGRPSRNDHLLNVGDGFAAVVLISVAGLDRTESPGSVMPADLGGATSTVDTGVIQSVVKSLLEEAGGEMECFIGTGDSRIYRIVLPYGNIEVPYEEGGALPEEIRSYIAHWQVLLARSARSRDFLEDKLREAGMQVERVDNVMSALARVETGSGLHVIVIEKSLLGTEADGLLKAVMKLCPTTGVVVLCDDPSRENMIRDIVFVPTRTEPEKVIRAIVDAKALAVRRRAQ